MTRKDYILIAKVLGAAVRDYDRDLALAIADDFVEALSAENERFDLVRFLALVNHDPA